MHYWRDNNFKALAAISELIGDDLDLKHFSNYLRLRERGLRKEAFLQLEQFSAQTRHWGDEKRRQFVHWVMSMKREWSGAYDLLPTPLWKRLIGPILDKWIQDEPENPVPLRWRGRLEDLRRAIEIEPTEQIARELLVSHLLHQVDYSIHELPNGFGYLGNETEDLEKLKEVETLAVALPSDLRERLFSEVALLREIVEGYISYKHSASRLRFCDWMSSQGRTVLDRWEYHPFPGAVR